MPCGETKYLVLIGLCCILFVQNANAQDCRNYLQAARADIGRHIAALQRLEHEASDRQKGLDSRPFDFLLGEARKTAAIRRIRCGAFAVMPRRPGWRCWRNMSPAPSPTTTNRASPPPSGTAK